MSKEEAPCVARLHPLPRARPPRPGLPRDDMPSTPLPFHLQTTRMALVQLGQIGADKAFNLQHARSSVLRAVKEAPQGGVDLVMLPECFNSPYSVDKFRQYAESFSGLYEQVKRGGTDVAKNGGQRAWPIDNLDNARAVTLSQACLESSPSLRMLSMLAQEAGVVLVGGSVPEIDPDTDRIYNTSCVFDNEGTGSRLTQAAYFLCIASCISSTLTFPAR